MDDWSAPGAHEAAPGVFRVPLSMPNDGLHAINVYALETGDGLALVDGGWRTPTGFEELASALAGIGHEVSSVHDVFITHIHRDHYTLAIELRRRFGTRVHLGRDEAPGLLQLLDIESNVPVTSLQQLRRSGDPDLAAAVEAVTAAEEFDAEGWEKPDVWLEPGEYAVGSRMLDAVATPGHTKGHLVYHDVGGRPALRGRPSAADHHALHRLRAGGVGAPTRQLPLLAGRHVLQRPDARLLPAHGAPGPSTHSRATQLLEHHAIRLAETSRALDSQRQGDRITGGAAADVDPPPPRLRRAGPVQPDVRDLRDHRPPRRARGEGRAPRSSTIPRASVFSLA